MILTSKPNLTRPTLMHSAADDDEVAQLLRYLGRDPAWIV
jgi:hypothetical protein